MNDYKSIADFADDHDEWVVSPTKGFCEIVLGKRVFLFAFPHGPIDDPWITLEAAPPGSGVTGSLITGTITKFGVDRDDYPDSDDTDAMVDMELMVELPDGSTALWDFCDEWMDIIYLEEAA